VASEQPDIERLADTAREAITMHYKRERHDAGLAALDELVARLKTAERRLATLGDTTIGLKAVEAVCDRAEAAEARVAELEAALRSARTYVDGWGGMRDAEALIVKIDAALAGDGGGA
jgi:hypothetical protein